MAIIPSITECLICLEASFARCSITFFESGLLHSVRRRMSLTSITRSGGGEPHNTDLILSAWPLSGMPSTTLRAIPALSNFPARTIVKISFLGRLLLVPGYSSPLKIGPLLIACITFCSKPGNSARGCNQCS